MFCVNFLIDDFCKVCLSCDYYISHCFAGITVNPLFSSQIFSIMKYSSKIIMFSSLERKYFYT